MGLRWKDGVAEIAEKDKRGERDCGCYDEHPRQTGGKSTED